MWPLMRLCEGMAARKALLQKVVGHDGEEIDKEKEHFEEEEHFEEIDSEEEELLIDEVMAKRIEFKNLENELSPSELDKRLQKWNVAVKTLMATNSRASRLGSLKSYFKHDEDYCKAQDELARLDSTSLLDSLD